MTQATEVLPPIERSVLVSWDQEAAFRRFTSEFASWWPSSTHSIGGRKLKRVVFECRAGGRIYEELKDGRRFQWGKVTTWEPSQRVGFTWHPSKDEATAQDVEVSFARDAEGTRVVLRSWGWERLGAKAAQQRKGYLIGWGSVLDGYAGNTTPTIVLFALISHGITLLLKLTGRLEAEIDKAGGRMPADTA